MTAHPRRSLLRARRLLPLLVILAIATLLRVCPPLDRESVWGDEILSIVIARLPIEKLIPQVIVMEQIPPAHHLLLHFWIKIFGDSETSVRAPSAIAGVAGVFMTYVFVRRLMGRRVALITALLLAVSPMHIAYSREARTYTLAVLVGLASMDLFVRLLRRPTPRLNALYVVCSAVLLYTHLYGIFVIAAQHLVYAIVLLRAWRRGGVLPLRPKQWIVNNVAVALLFSPWVPVVLKWTKMVAVSFWVKRASMDDISRSYWVYSGSTAAYVVFIALFVVAIWQWLYRRPRAHRTGMIILLALTLVPVVVPVIYSVLTRPSFATRYSIIASVGWCALAAAGIAAFRSRLMRGSALAVAVAVSVMAIHGPATAIPREPWRDVANYLHEKMRPGDLAVVHIKAATRMYDYYNRRPNVRRLGFDAGSVPVSLPLPPGQHVWFVKYEEWSPLKQIIERGPWYIVSHQWFGGMLVMELDDDFPEGTRPEDLTGAKTSAAEAALAGDSAPATGPTTTMTTTAPATMQSATQPSAATLPTTSSP